MEAPEETGTLTLETHLPSPWGVGAGDFVWGLGKGELWWPGRVRGDGDVPAKAARERPEGEHCVFVAYFGDGGAGWCGEGNVKPFEAGFEGLTVQSPSKGLAKAVAAAVGAFGRCLEAEMSCGCLPEVARKSKAKGGGVSVVVANAVPSEVLQDLRAVACDVSARSVLEVAVVRGWVAAFARGMGRYAPLPEYNVYRGLPQFKEKADSSSNGGELLSDGQEVWEGEGKKQRSMAELIAGLDLEMDGEGEDEKGVVSGSRMDVLRRRQKEDHADIRDQSFENVDDVKAEDGVGTGRRERKKSKYLSPPYTLVDVKVKRAFGPRSSEKKTAKQDSEESLDINAEEGQPEKISRSRSAVRYRANAYQDENDFVLDEKTAPADELLIELHLVALDVTYLEGNEFDHNIRGFFGRFRRLVYIGGAEVESDSKLKSSSSGASTKTPGPMNHGSLEKEKTPAQEGNASIEGKSGKGKKRKPLATTNGSVGAKPRNYMKKKSIDGIVNNGMQEPKSSGCKRAAPSSQEANGLDDGKSAQKSKRKKKGANDGKEAPQMAAAFKEADGSEGGESSKKRNRKKKEQANTDSGVIPDGSEKGKSAKKKYRKKEWVTIDLGLTPAVNAGQEVDGTEKGKSANKRNEQVNGEMGSTSTVPVVQEANGTEEGKSVKQRNRKEEQVNAEMVGTPTVPMGQETNGSGEGNSVKKTEGKKKLVVGVDIGAVAQAVPANKTNGEGKPKQKRQRMKKVETNAAEGAILAMCAVQEANGEGKPKQKRIRKKKEEANADKGAALLLSFSKGVELPSKEELISTYSKFGTLSESEISLLKDSGSASIVFAKKSDAEKAFNSPDRDRAFGSNLAACQLRYLHGDSSILAPSTSTPKPPLEFVKKSLESMITTLTASGLSVKDVLGPDVGLKLDSKENLVDEMSGLLKKVNNLLTGGPSSAGGGATAGPAT